MSTIYRHSKLRLIHPQYLLTWPLFFLIWLIGQLSHRSAVQIGRCTGRFFSLMFPKRKYIIKTNLKLCFPDKSEAELKSLVTEHFQSLVTGVFETAIAWYGSEKQLKELDHLVVFQGEEILQAHLNSEKPLLLVASHCVSQELLSKYLCRKYAYTPVFRHMNNPVANFLMQKARIRIYKHLILKANTRTIVKSVKNGQYPVAILPDQDFGIKRSIFIPFFGIPAATTTSLSKYKKLTDATMLMLSYYRKFNVKTGQLEKIVIKIDNPLAITGHDLLQDATEFNNKLEQIIKKDIAAYFWVARKFKTRPSGIPKVYNYKSSNPLKKILSIGKK